MLLLDLQIPRLIDIRSRRKTRLDLSLL